MNLDKIKSSTFSRIGDRYNHFFDFDHFMGRNPFEDSWLVKTPAYVEKQKECYRLEIALPGVDKSAIQLTVKDGNLTLQAGEGYWSKLSERITADNDSRSFRLPPNVDEEAIKADYKNGLLSINIPYKEEPDHIGKKVQIT